MTVTALRPPVFAGQVAAARVAVAAAGQVPAWSLEIGELGEAVSELSGLESQVAALKLSLLAEADLRRVAAETAATGTDAWAARLTGSTRAVMAGGIWLANLLATRYEATRQAFADGGLTQAQAQVIVSVAETLPSGVSAEQRAAAEQVMVAKAVSGMNPRGLRQAGRRMAEVISRQFADDHEADQLEREKARAERETWLTLHDNGDGTFSGRFLIPELHANLLRTMLEKLTAPRRVSQNAAGEPVVDHTLPGAGPSLNWSERLGAAFIEMLEHLPNEGHGPVGATLLVTISADRLNDGLASAGLDTGVRISSGEARRLACNAGIVPVVLGGASEVLDLGRERRLHSRAQRRALALVHTACSTEGCDRPFAWCEIHHPKPWGQGGSTTMDNALPLCGYHHRRAHDRAYSMRLMPSGEARFRRRR